MLQLANYVNSLGIKTKRGNPFENRTIDYILNNPVYIGKARWTPTGKIRRNFNHPDALIKDSDHDPIVDIDVWDRAQERIKENKEIYRKREKTTTQIKTWLKGIVRCSECGSTLITFQNKYMQCNGFLKGRCKSSAHILIERLETAVLEELKKTYSGEIEIHIVPCASDTARANEFEIVQDRLNKMADKEIRVKTAYEDGIDTIEEYRENKKRLMGERQNLKEALEALKDDIIEDRHEEGIINKITSVYELLTDETESLENKYQTAHFLISQITYSKQEKTLRLIYK